MMKASLPDLATLALSEHAPSPMMAARSAGTPVSASPALSAASHVRSFLSLKVSSDRTSKLTLPHPAGSPRNFGTLPSRPLSSPHSRFPPLNHFRSRTRATRRIALSSYFGTSATHSPASRRAVERTAVAEQFGRLGDEL